MKPLAFLAVGQEKLEDVQANARALAPRSGYDRVGQAFVREHGLGIHAWNAFLDGLRDFGAGLKAIGDAAKAQTSAPYILSTGGSVTRRSSRPAW